MDDREVQALLVRVRSGEADAFGELYQYYYAPIYRFVLLKVRHKETAEDITQSVFTRAYASIGEYEERGVPFRAWLYRIAGNAVIDFYKKKRDVILEEDSTTFLTAESPEDSSKEAIDRERRQMLLGALMKLREHEREVMELRFMEELSYADISEILGVSEEALRATVYRAKKTLKHELQNYYGS